MAMLTSWRRNRLSSQTFAIPSKRAYPIYDRSHARNALARVAQYGSAAEQAQVRSAVRRRWPTIEVE